MATAVAVLPEAAPNWGARTFAALNEPNYRRWSAGQLISMIGTWMQTVAQSWLVLQITGSGSMLGLVVALQFVPVLVLSPHAGLLADRVDKRRLLVATQVWMGAIAATLGLLVVTDQVQLWNVLVLAVLLGVGNAVDNPTRQSFVIEMVGPDRLRNAVSLNSVMMNSARAIGPAIAGLTIAAYGVGICFLVNAGSYVAAIAALMLLDRERLVPAVAASREPGQVRQGLAYVRRTPELLVPLVMMALIGTLTYEFQVVLPVVAEETFGAGAKGYGFMTAAMGAGAVIGGLWSASRRAEGLARLARSAATFGVAVLATALAPNMAVALVALLFVGVASVSFLAGGNTTLQLAAEPQMRGRVMALWSMAFLGSTPIGGPIVGYVAEHAGPRWGLGLGAAAALTAAALGAVAVRRLRSRHPNG